jgi:lysophospholipase
VRSAGTISDNERKYVTKRAKVACESLAKWLKNIHPGFRPSNLPSIGLATSGGGFRSILSGAGVIQAFDSREFNQTLGGLFQALTYHGGLSGGSLLVGSLAGNNWPTITSLKTGLWETTLAGLPSEAASAQFLADMTAKDAVGFVPTLVDVFGRVLSFDVLLGPDTGVSETISGIRSKGQFSANAAQFPIITAINTSPGHASPNLPIPNSKHILTSLAVG